MDARIRARDVARRRSLLAGAAVVAIAATAYFVREAIASPPRGVSGVLGAALVFGIIAMFGGVCGFGAWRGRRLRLRLYAEGFELGGGRTISRVRWDEVVALWRLERRSSVSRDLVATTGLAIDTASGRRAVIARVFGPALGRIEDRLRARDPIRRARARRAAADLAASVRIRISRFSAIRSREKRAP